MVHVSAVYLRHTKEVGTMKNIFKMIAGFGFFLLIGTAGAGDVDAFSISRIAFQMVVSILMMFSGSVGTYVVSERKRKRRRHLLKNV